MWRLANFWIVTTFWVFAIGCVSLVFSRLKKIGHPNGWFSLHAWYFYRMYWKAAPEQGWSRAPLIVGAAAWGLGLYFLMHPR